MRGTQLLLALAAATAVVAGAEDTGECAWLRGGEQREGEREEREVLPMPRALDRRSLPLSDAPPLTLVVHLSDLHISSNRPTPLSAAYKGDPAADAVALAAGPLSFWRPTALLITGDVTHAKSPDGRTRQCDDEWDAYAGVVAAAGAALEGEGGVAEAAAAARGARRGARTPPQPPPRVLDVRGNHDAFNVAVRGNASHDPFVRAGVAGRRAGGGRVAPAAVVGGRVLHGAPSGAPPTLPACPSLLLLGVDATPAPGLSGSNNFGGVVGARLAAATREASAALSAAAATACPPASPPPPLLAYGHYPLATLATEHAAPRADAPRLADALGGGGEGGKSNTHTHRAYLSGHLHSLFGPRLRRFLPSTSLAELETAAWTDDRRLRIVTADGGVLAFSDVHWKAAPRAPAKWRAADTSPPHLAWPDGTPVGAALLHMSYPPDGRLAAGGVASTQRRVRVVALSAVCPTGGGGGDACAGAPPPPSDVSLNYACTPSGATGTLTLAPDASASAAVGPGGSVWAAEWPRTACAPADTLTYLTPTAASATIVGHPTPSPLVDGAPGVGTTPLPQDDVSGFEYFFVSVDWQLAALRLFWGLWTAHFALALLLPRALARYHIGAAVDAAVARTARPWARPLVAAALWLPAALADNASTPSFWLPQALYSAYLAVGPWAVVRTLGATPPGLYFPRGVLLPPGGVGPTAQRGGFLPTPDAARVGAIHLAIVVGPVTLWLAAVARARAVAQRAGRGGPSRAAVISLALAALPVAAAARLFARAFVWQVGGPLAMATGVGLTWAAPLAGVLVVVDCARARRGGGGGGGGRHFRQGRVRMLSVKGF